MASYNPPLVSPFLREAAALKISELYRAKAEFKNRYQENPNLIKEGGDPLKRVTVLLEQIKKLDPYLEDEDDLETISRYLEQAKNDRSVSTVKLEKFEKQLHQKIEFQSNRFEVSSLHVELLNEALAKSDSTASVTEKLEQASLDDEFEVVEEELESVFEKFEKHTFAQKPIDIEALEKYLEQAFENEHAKAGLGRLREDVKDYAEELMDGRFDITDEDVEWSVQNLISHGLLSDEKKRTLQGYLESPAAIRELRSTINMKSIRHWKWQAPDGLRVSARQDAEGRHCIVHEECLTDAIFLHTLATGWGAKLRYYLTDLVADRNIFARTTIPMAEDMEKREYYLFGPKTTFKKPPPKPSVCTVCHGPPPFPAPAPIPAYHPVPRAGYIPPPRAPVPIVRAPPKRKFIRRRPIIIPNTVDEERVQNYVRNFFLSRLPEEYGCSFTLKSPHETQAELIKVLAVEAKTRETFDGEVHGFAANFKSFASSLPHETILTILKYIGVPDLWLEVFTRFLRAPLNMGPIVRGTSDQVLTRACGLPIAHSMEVLFTELVLFFLDFAVYRETEGRLYRLRDKCYFVGKKECNEKAQEVLKSFAQNFGLECEIESMEKTTIGHVVFSIVDGKVSFDIDQDKTHAFARRASKKLADCTTVLDWIRTWNHSVGEYAPHLFGPLANVFGPEYVEKVTAAYNRIHETIFDESNLVDYVKSLLERVRFPLNDPPFSLEPIILLPTQYGGLGVKNPYVSLNLARGAVQKPEQYIETLLTSEKKHYERAKESFLAYTPHARQKSLEAVFNGDKACIAETFGEKDPMEFMSFADFTKYREMLVYPFLQLPPWPTPVPPPERLPCVHSMYSALLREPINHIEASDRVCQDVRDISDKRWSLINGEERWVLQMYSEECYERYGGMKIWASEPVPQELLKLFRGEKEEDFNDDASSILSDV